MQVYAVLHDPNGNILLGTRNERGHFFGEPGDLGVVYDVGRELPNGGRVALPGGGLDPWESIEAGAAREFREETGIELKLSGADRTMQRREYCAAYFERDDFAFAHLVTDVIPRRLRDGRDAAADVEDREITRYAQIHHRYPEAPWDNELREVATVNVHTRWARLERILRADQVPWYLDILAEVQSFTRAPR